jgi:hypothetical protein
MNVWVGVATTLVGIVISGVISWRVGRRNALAANRDNLVLNGKSEVYDALEGQALLYLHGRLVDPALPSDASLEVRLNRYASPEVREAWRVFREAMEPVGAGQSLSRMIGEALRAPESSSVDEINQRNANTDAKLQEMAWARYEQLAAVIRKELTGQ